jgi:hypothetical protein
VSWRRFHQSHDFNNLILKEVAYVGEDGGSVEKTTGHVDFFGDGMDEKLREQKKNLEEKRLLFVGGKKFFDFLMSRR